MTFCKWVVTILIHTLIAFPTYGQNSVARFDPGKEFVDRDYSITYFDNYTRTTRFSFQIGDKFTRLSLDSNFVIQNSYTFSSKEKTFTPKKSTRSLFLESLVLESGAYEVYGLDNIIRIYKPDFIQNTDSLVFTLYLRLIEKDEKLLAIFPANNRVQILTSGIKNNLLLLYSWAPGTDTTSVTLFNLPESNIDKSQYKEYPKDARINFKKYLFVSIVQPLGDISLTSRPGPKLYYSDSTVYILMQVPFFLGVFTIKLDIQKGLINTYNYLINDLTINAGTNNKLIKYPTGFIIDTLLVIKNLSATTYEYLFYDVNRHKLLKKYEANAASIDALVHSKIRQKGTWASEKEEKEFLTKETYLKKGGGFIIPTAVVGDSITITNLSIMPTTGVRGTLLDFIVPFPLMAAGVPSLATVLLPPLGTSRDRIIYFHSRFCISNLTPSKSSDVRTVLDELIDDSKNEALFSDMCFLLRNKGYLYLGNYSKKDNKIEVYRYFEKHH